MSRKAIIEGGRGATIITALMVFGANACEPVATAPASLSDGVYCLVGDVTASGAFAFSLGQDVVLDCRGHRITDSAGTGDTGIKASGDNIVVKNCVVDGFLQQLHFDGTTTNYRIIDNVFVNARSSPESFAIGVDGRQGLIARNIIRSPSPQTATWTGLYAVGGDIIGNTLIMGRNSTSNGYNRYGMYADDGVVANNIITSVAAGAREFGAALTVGEQAITYRNVLVTAFSKLQQGMVCYGNPGPRLQNLIIGFSPYISSGCGDTSLETGLRQRARSRGADPRVLAERRR